MRKKIGLLGVQEKDQDLWTDLFRLMEIAEVDYTILFRTLSSYSMGRPNSALHNLFNNQEEFGAWLNRYDGRLKQQEDTESGRQERMKAVNPKYILRNYLAQHAIEKAEKEQDYSEVNRLLALLYRPFDEHEGMEAYAEAPPDWGKSLVISCSS
jgi:uncharacterized protein YdiU (UPF0061 family)